MDAPVYYEIRIKGHLASAYADWFDGMSLSNLENGQCTLSGNLPDQSALHGILNRISSLGLTLISVNAVPEENLKNKRRPDNE